MTDLMGMVGGRKSEEKNQAPGGMPVGCIQPIFQASSTQMKRTMEKPTRNARRGGHVALFGRLALGGRSAATHHVHQGRTQTDQNGKKRDGDKNFHERIIQ
jgi:hypothetical protein